MYNWVSEHFGTESYAWKVAIIQNLYDYCRFLCMIFWVKLDSNNNSNTTCEKQFA